MKSQSRPKHLSAAQRLERDLELNQTVGLTPNEIQLYLKLEHQERWIIYIAIGLSSIIVLIGWFILIGSGPIIDVITSLLIGLLTIVVLSFGLSFTGKAIYLLTPSYQLKQRLIEKVNNFKRLEKDFWLDLRGYDLEKEMVKLYQKLGYTVEHRGGAHDKGVDLILAKNGQTIVVQCKGVSKAIGPNYIRELLGTFVDHPEAENAIIVCPAGFTDDALKAAYGKPLYLVDFNSILILQQQVIELEAK